MKQNIEIACKELNPDSIPGLDGIPAELLRTARAELAQPLHILWQASLVHGSITTELLLVQVLPLHKGGSRSAAKNYQPVVLTSHMTKVSERVMRKVLVSHLEEHSVLPDGQHGFQEGPFRAGSCLTQLLSFWDTLLEEMEQGKGVDVVYTDCPLCALSFPVSIGSIYTSTSPSLRYSGSGLTCQLPQISSKWPLIAAQSRRRTVPGT